ncbi:MAG TPA: TIGR03435 family protein [Candidatus Acidoferrum sp.]
MKNIACTADFSGKFMLGKAGCMGVSILMVFGAVYTRASRARSRQSPDAAPSYEYEVASIKPNKSGTNMIRLMFTPSGLGATNVTLGMLIRTAYGIEENQISGGPSWLKSDHYDIDAKMDSPTADALHKLAEDQRRLATQHMMQALLADRFKLVVHHDSKELAVYALVVAKNGPKLHEAKPGDAYPNGIKGPDGVARPGMMRMGRGQLTSQGLPLSELARLLTAQLDRTVVDKTGLTGNYDFTLQWTPDESQGAMFRGPDTGPQASASSANSSGPSLFTALQEQLGLKLESQKGPVEIYVIDHAEKPSEN